MFRNGVTGWLMPAKWSSPESYTTLVSPYVSLTTLESAWISLRVSLRNNAVQAQIGGSLGLSPYSGIWEGRAGASS